MTLAPALPCRADTAADFERAKRVGYVIQRGRHGPGRRYWRWCQVNARPLVAVVVRGRTATVGCDMSPLGINARIFPEAMRRIDAMFGWPVGDETGPIDYVHVEGVPVEQAEALAFRLYDVVKDCDWPS